ncbi:GIY-YIG nuclease family protein [Patescibacteria group bacterium]|nr:MAG: GIY-YIG nuclease family protein [Patescibacteria group bacterium]
MYSVYILKSQVDLRYYIGQTENLEARILLHNQGGVPSTKSRRPLELVKSESFATRTEARKRENYLKSLKGGNEFRKIVEMT